MAFGIRGLPTFTFSGVHSLPILTVHSPVRRLLFSSEILGNTNTCRATVGSASTTVADYRWDRCPRSLPLYMSLAVQTPSGYSVQALIRGMSCKEVTLGFMPHKCGSAHDGLPQAHPSKLLRKAQLSARANQILSAKNG